LGAFAAPVSDRFSVFDGFSFLARFGALGTSIDGLSGRAGVTRPIRLPRLMAAQRV
jgi:hypothetical protein